MAGKSSLSGSGQLWWKKMASHPKGIKKHFGFKQTGHVDMLLGTVTRQ